MKPEQIMKYKGHEYSITCDSSSAWGNKKNLFKIESATGNTGKYYSTRQEAERAAVDFRDTNLILRDFTWEEGSK